MVCLKIHFCTNFVDFVLVFQPNRIIYRSGWSPRIGSSNVGRIYLLSPYLNKKILLSSFIKSIADLSTVVIPARNLSEYKSSE
ncbi:hypothetical protein BpHYR1_004633 [Brachionus plicatilis]|uniref:Uncharacterized protein n=1 Tax=Brachionus plicatilis TaxID=10195 RepID=A0A3M7S802_BRAPC|nr:hypothetical protein BpHYR1_004633 [Brachionus plicatilis]